ncbi:Las17-binding protein actin regulator [Aliiroseovarius halocynthiae]|uniref:Twin-arginine translocation pathway signal n=1 Tax=Aliiroseovarius halocynthiae TaxID=985055 RepID=A0A545SWB2_9RHOB|nr:YSC84-related protein [Aliiroseovarius halocynthiae]TQV69251.1 twin-arginine translocation pathway signal [Aliiroseovarius halocynthiae]SMR72022.1 Las17-binding protein actin regulator [Aliiroseovarius halocynthiae]
MQNSILSRRGFLVGVGGASVALAACDNSIGSSGGAKIDARVNSTLSYLYDRYPGTRQLAEKSNGQLVMPLVTEAGFGFGGAYGRGALRINDVTVDYYSLTQASAGLQIGAQQYAHVLFFMTNNALQGFRSNAGWVASADVKYAFQNEGDRLTADTITTTSPVVAVVFGQTGLIAGAAIEGAKYSRIIP